MALSIYSNIYSLNAQKSLTIANNAQAKTIEKLSTGLRINSSADDASGLAISEKLRGQIRGLKRASMNAQDGISYLQTAEGGMVEMTNMLQRMRELSVQAGNGVYTTNDRSMLQLEVDQLKEEVNRIANSTEFNTKKLLNGNSTAVWSSDKPYIGAIVNGPNIAEGNYKLDIDMVPGTNTKYKTDIMGVNKGVLVSEVTGNPTGNIGSVRDPNGLPISNGNDYNAMVGMGTGQKANTANATVTNTVKVGNINVAYTGTLTVDVNQVTISAGGTNPGFSTVPPLKFSSFTTLGAADSSMGYYEVEFMEGGAAADNTKYRYRTMDAQTGKFSEWRQAVTDGAEAIITNDKGEAFTVTRDAAVAKGHKIEGTYGSLAVSAGSTNGSTKVNSMFKQDGSNLKVTNSSVTNASASYSGFYEVEFTEGGTSSSALTYKYRVVDAKTGEVGNWQAGTIVPGAASATMTLNLDGVAAGATSSAQVTIHLPPTSAIVKGDKLLGTFQPQTPAVAGMVASGGGTIQLSNGPTIVYDKPGALTKEDNGNYLLDYNKVTVYHGSMDTKTGIVDWGNLTMEFKEQNKGIAGTLGTGLTDTGSSKINVRDDGAATKDTKLADIARFTTSDGRMVLSNTQEIKIYGKDGKTATLYLEADDTIEDFQKKLTQALVDKLDMGSDDPTSAGTTVNDNLVNYVPNGHATDNSSEAVSGTFIIQTAMMGKDSDLVFVGDQALIDALSLATIQKGVNSSMDVKVTDAHTGKFIGKDNISDGKLRNVVEGVDVTINQNAGVDITWNDSKKLMEYKPNGQTESAFLHVVDTRTELQIGANEGQIINVSVGQLDTTGLEIDDVYVMSMDQSQRSITKLDKAIEKINAVRSTVGAQINRLEYTINNLSTASENLTAAESRIRDLDIASASTELSKNQILVQASTAMLAQANQIPKQALQLLQG